MALIPLFKEQLENESKAIAVERSLKKRGDYLIWWYFRRLMDLKDAEIEEFITDGYDDYGIDVLRVEDADKTVHFYNFKNPTNLNDAFPSSEVDKLLTGLGLIIQNELGNAGGNVALKRQAAEILKLIPTGYRIHLVHSGTGMQPDVAVKLNGFIKSVFLQSLSAPDEFCTWHHEDIGALQTRFYSRSRPTVEDQFVYKPESAPYSVTAAGHDAYMLTMPATELASLYQRHGEALLQQNIRIGQGDKGTNANIRKTASGTDSGNFLHYNNGVVFLAEVARYDPLTRQLTMSRYQVVNGGQTMRTLSAASGAGELRPDVTVPVRVITSGNDKDFASNVTVNLNNQNRIKDSFLRSNDPQVIQLASALRTLGWYLERREKEAANLTQSERSALEAAIGGHPLDDRTIELSAGLQAYVASFMSEPELAKRYPKRIFAAAEDNGEFERVFKDLTAEKFIAAHRLRAAIETYVAAFGTIKRKNQGVSPKVRNAAYAAHLGKDLTRASADLDAAIPPAALFLCAAVYFQEVKINGNKSSDLVAVLESGDYSTLNATMLSIIKARRALADRSSSWPTLLKSQTLFAKFTARAKQGK